MTLHSRHPLNLLSAVLIGLAGLSAEHAAAQQTGDLEALRAHALELVNADRAAESLPPLQQGEALNEAALAHARDMLERDYYAHASPEGETVEDRYQTAGGGRWERVAENLSRCTGCGPKPDLALVEELQRGWMQSPEHRANILSEGLSRFGFGIVGEGQEVFAVQTFAGPGTPRGLAEGKEPQPVAAEEQTAVFLREINDARREAGAPPLEAAPALAAAARNLLSDPADEFALGTVGDPYAALPANAQSAWSRLALISGACGGCGTEPAIEDIVFFAGDWLSVADYRQRLTARDHTHIGFALAADGEGKKIAIALLGQQR